MTLKVHDRNRQGLNMSRYLVFHCTMYLDREEKDLQPISSAFNNCVWLLSDFA